MRALIARLEDAGIDYALCGGLALAVHALPRATVDIDLLVPEAALDLVKAQARALGFTIDGDTLVLKKGIVEIHRLSKIDRESGDLLVLDLLRVTPKMRKAWDTRQELEWESGRLHVVSRAGLIALKSLRLSGQDKEDIRQLRKKPRRKR